MKDHTEKTNAMRILERSAVPYRSYSLGIETAVSGVEAAAIMGKDPETVYKTLVTKAKSGTCCVFIIPVAKELDLKKAAAAAGEKSVSMLPQKELFPTTGYVHGGCSPIGMRKKFPTILDASAAKKGAIVFSAGKIGWQIEMSPQDLCTVTECRLADICL